MSIGASPVSRPIALIKPLISKYSLLEYKEHQLNFKSGIKWPPK